MRKKPTPPTAAEIQAYRQAHDCGIYTAKDTLQAEYENDRLEWLFEAVEHLLEDAGVTIEEDEHPTHCLCDRCEGRREGRRARR